MFFNAFIIDSVRAYTYLDGDAADGSLRADGWPALGECLGIIPWVARAAEELGRHRFCSHVFRGRRGSGASSETCLSMLSCVW